MRQLQAAMTARGTDSVTAAARSHGILWATVQQQAAILTFNDVFRLMAVIFIILVPLSYTMRRPRSGPKHAPQKQAVVSD